MMYGQEKRKSPRNVTLIMDWIHIVLGTLIVVMAIIAFLNPESNQVCFPLIFFLASALNIINGVYRCRQSGREKKKKVLALGQLVIALALLGVTVVSAVSIWG